MVEGVEAILHAPEQGESLAPASVTYWRLAEMVGAAFMSVVTLALVGAVTFSAGQLWVAFVCGGVVFVVSSAWAMLSPSLRYRRFRFSFHERRLWIRSGVFFHREKSIPLARIQHVDISRGPLERMFRLARVTVFTAGGRQATAIIPGLEPARADALRLALLNATETFSQGET